jgi:hypothetical protein
MKLHVTKKLGEAIAQQETLDLVKEKLARLLESSLPERGILTRMSVNALQDGIDGEDQVVDPM